MQLVAMQNVDSETQEQALARQKRFQLAKLLRCTEEMLVYAQEEDWEAVEELEYSRRDEIISCFSEPLHKETPLIKEALATLIYLNEQISQLVKKAKNAILVNQSDLERGKGAVNKYQQLQENF